MRKYKLPGKKWHVVVISTFAICGIIGIGIGVYQQNMNANADKEFRKQIATLLNASTTQASIDDVKKIGTDMKTTMQEGFDRVVSAIKAKPILLQPLKPVPVAQVPASVPTIENTRLIQRPTISDDPKFPYGLQVIIQSNVTIQPFGVALECDKEVGKVNFFIAGQAVNMSMMTDIVGPQKNIALLRFGFPPLTPESSLIVTLLSKTQIRVVKASKLNP